MSFLLGAAAAGLAVFDLFGNKGQKLTITNDIMTQMTVDAATSSVTNCFLKADGKQEITISSDFPSRLNPKLIEACNFCQASLISIYNARQALETKTGHPQIANAQLVNIMTTGSSDISADNTTKALGPCDAMCHDTVVVNVSQSLSLKATQNCSVTNDMNTSISQSINAQISAQLKNQQDFMGQLSTAFTSNQQSITNRMSDTFSQNVTTNFVQDLNQSLQASQSITVTGNSILAFGIAQTFTGEMVGQLQVNNTVTDQLRQSASYSISQTLLNKNDTVGDLARNFLQVVETLTGLLETLTTQILIIVAAIIAAVLLVVGALFVFNSSFHEWTQVTVMPKLETKVANYLEKPAEKIEDAVPTE